MKSITKYIIENLNNVYTQQPHEDQAQEQKPEEDSWLKKKAKVVGKTLDKGIDQASIFLPSATNIAAIAGNKNLAQKLGTTQIFVNAGRQFKHVLKS